MSQFIKTLVCIITLTLLISAKTFAQTVYVQETGKKYHMKNCSVAGNGKKGMTVAEAKKAGYFACKVCKPDEAMPVEKPKAAPTPKAGEKPKAAEPKKTPTEQPKQ